MSSNTVLDRIIHNPIIQTFVIFISGGWIILEITDYVIENYGLNDNARNILLIILLSILPVALFLSWYLNRKQKDKESPSSTHDDNSGRKSLSVKSRRIIFPLILIILAVGVTFGFRTIKRSRIDRLLNGSLPRLVEEVKYMAYSEGLKNWTVYSKAAELRKVLRNNPDFINFWKDLTVPVNISSEPVGAKVFAKPYALPDTAWIFLVKHPLKNSRSLRECPGLK